MKDNLSLTQKSFSKEFPDIGIENVKIIDMKIKTKVMAYESTSINNDISKFIQMEVVKYVRSKNQGKINKKCKKLASLYLDNSRQCILQESWFCLLAYFITIVAMIVRVIEVETSINDKIFGGVYFITLFAWVIIVDSKKLMSKKVEKFLRAFNNHAPAIIVLSSLIFYFVVCLCPMKPVWILSIVVPFATCILLTILWYKRQM